MTFPIQNTGLFTDHYELVMAEGYFLSGLNNYPVAFDYFFRKNSFKGGYTVFAGLNTLLDFISNFGFEDEDLNFLSLNGFDDNFLNYLKNFRFRGNIYSVKEGEIVFPNEPVIRVEGGLAETQLIETLLLNTINFQSLIATKASRMKYVSEGKTLMDFGLRRAQGLGGIHATRAAAIGGFELTSNVYSASLFGLKSSGTMAHSWIQNFSDELEAFRTFAKHFPDQSILLVDTYDTLKSGIPNAIQIAGELRQKGAELKGIRLDSGDLAYLSKVARKMLDKAGFENVRIVASNQLDEHLIKSLEAQHAPIDVYGVGTALATGKNDPALDGVYKLAMTNHLPSMKFSENQTKETLPGIKSLSRFTDQNNQFVMDGIALDHEKETIRFMHPFDKSKFTTMEDMQREFLLDCVMTEGEIDSRFKNLSISDSSAYFTKRFTQLPEEFKRFENPHLYKVGISEKLFELKTELRKRINHESATNSGSTA
ncbi:MAG: nicotinate phosphoribosyltransferase [Bacteroidales bacterium]|nr:nicotinate phosphoribosyltransferase [Bacteroidales bacterium]